MDRISELNKIYDDCTQWLEDHPNATHTEWKEISDRRLSALQEKKEIFTTQLKNIKDNE